MKCPYCGETSSRVIDTREVGDGIRRRRECQACRQRYTTYEHVAKANLVVVKRDGRREPFDRQKLLDGLMIACAKRPVSMEAIEALVADVETSLYRLGQAEVSSHVIGERVMDVLKALDAVAYVRFASVYRQFADLCELQREVQEMLAEDPSSDSPNGAS